MTTKIDLQALAWLVAEATVRCRSCEGDGSYIITVGNDDESSGSHEEDLMCSSCGGTGEVLRFPEMSQPCLGSNNELLHQGIRLPPDKHEYCRGTGRVPIEPDAGKLLDLMRGAGYYIEIRLGADSICAEVFPNIKSYKQLVNIEGKEFTLTVYEAVVKAMEASHAG